ncbi:MAG: hypothetical protein KF774_19135 [Planctomyces sp.]|nr:hypothetical protein [Planctomyces sp.]
MTGFWRSAACGLVILCGGLSARVDRVQAADALRVGAATVEMQAEDEMVIGGGIGPGRLTGQEGKLQATALVVAGDTRLCLVAVDVLMINRDYLDPAAKRIEEECGIPFENILINSSHTHHAPSTVTIHGYQREEEFCRRTVEAIVAAAKEANARAEASVECQPVYRLGQEATVGQNSRLLLNDGFVFWIGPRENALRPTGPFDVDLPVLAFRKPDGGYAGLLFNHSTHCIGTRQPKRSPGFYGLAAQELSEELEAPCAFFSGAAGSTHNLILTTDEMVLRLKGAIHDSLQAAQPMSSTRLAAVKREFTYRVREFDEETEERKCVDYCQKYAPQGAEYIAQVFRDMREILRPQQGQERSTWLQALRIGDAYFVAVPAEYFTVLGIEIKRRSPHRNTFVFGLSNDYIGYVPNRDAYDLGGYQTWTGLHSFVERGTGEAIVDECVRMLEEVGRE